MSEATKKGLLSWLRSTGYPFQLQAGRSLRSAGWHVNNSRWYKDSDTGKYRETDLQAITGAVRGGEAALFSCLSIECKDVRDLPWVGLSSRKDGGGRSYPASAPGIMTRRFALAAQALEVALPNLLPPDIVYVDSVVAGFVSTDDGESRTTKRKAKEQGDPTSPYSALLQAVAGARAYDTEYFGIAVAGRPQFATATLVLPVVLIRGELYAYAVDASLNDELIKVEALLASVPFDNEDKSTLVAVVTEEFGRANWVSLHSAAHAFCVACLPHAGRIASALTMAERDIIKHV